MTQISHNENIFRTSLRKLPWQRTPPFVLPKYGIVLNGHQEHQHIWCDSTSNESTYRIGKKEKRRVIKKCFDANIVTYVCKNPILSLVSCKTAFVLRDHNSPLPRCGINTIVRTKWTISSPNSSPSMHLNPYCVSMYFV
ncbi:unnamed protein product [Albugo candida]|uniref:Uncharacterized protein n=1 Tax=Albugo candida TaxID=65357 RepID=A0A024G1N1_9STRA|nr:unnamed protein product [Albugo candida]|eukprot:CCI40565.1 unnamed protein product [Albugo candida]